MIISFCPRFFAKQRASDFFHPSNCAASKISSKKKFKSKFQQIQNESNELLYYLKTLYHIFISRNWIEFRLFTTVIVAFLVFMSVSKEMYYIFNHFNPFYLFRVDSMYVDDDYSLIATNRHLLRSKFSNWSWTPRQCDHMI